MPDPTQLNVHDITVTEQPFFGAGGSVQKRTRVTFFVGSHGPFMLEYDPAQATAEKIQSDINSQVQKLRIVTEASYTG